MRALPRPAALLWMALLLAGGLHSAHAAPVSYIYDDLGRLIAVIDEASDSAIYQYDAVGNLLSISRQSATTVSVLEFNPKQGPVGTSVTIHGMGFSPTPSQNTVTFNGTTATVTSASLTELIATVPAGATTGPIGVTAPGGSTASTTNFEVTATNGVPTITSFTPAIGAPGDATTVTGTNFDPTPSSNKLGFNATFPRQGRVDTATATSLGVTVAVAGTSGRLRVATEAGAAESAADFFVPPSPYPTADVLYTGRIVAGGANLTVTIATAGKIGLVVFDGVVGQRLSFGVSTCSPSVLLKAYRPDGGLLIDMSAGPFDLPALPLAGTHTVLVRANGSGSVNCALTLSEEVAGTITVGGPAVTSTISRPGQRARYTFEGTAGQRLSVGITSSTMTTTVSFVKPDGTTLASGLSSSGAVDTPPLPSAGTYAILVDPGGNTTGSQTLTLSEEVTGTITVNGAAVTASITRAGQRGRYTFDGTAGQRLSVGVTASTIPSGTATILDPSGATVGGPGSFSSSGGIGVDTGVLATTGAYAILIDPANAFTGNATLTLSEEVTGSITPGGPEVTVNITRAGQRARLSFSGTTNQRVSVVGGNGTITLTRISIIKPDGAALGTTVTFAASGGFMDTRVLDSTGSHALLLDPDAAYTGSKSVTLHDVPADVLGTLTINGGATPVPITTPGQNAQHTFSATSGQGITVRVTNNGAGCLAVTLHRPDGNQVGAMSPCASGNLAHTPTFTGTYTIKSGPSGATTGTFDLSVTNP